MKKRSFSPVLALAVAGLSGCFQTPGMGTRPVSSFMGQATRPPMPLKLHTQSNGSLTPESQTFPLGTIVRVTLEEMNTDFWVDFTEASPCADLQTGQSINHIPGHSNVNSAKCKIVSRGQFPYVISVPDGGGMVSRTGGHEGAPMAGTGAYSVTTCNGCVISVP